MKIRITADATLLEVQQAFQEIFPFLNLVFFTKPHKEFKGSPAKFMVMDTSKTLHEIGFNPADENLILDPKMATFHLEQTFEERYGLHVQVFRKSGASWLLTSVTDELSLEQQNAKGRASEHVHFMTNDPIDYREQE